MKKEDFNWIYRNDIRWKHFADYVKKRDNYVCQDCGTNERLQVHHVKYIYDGRMPWEYENEYVITLCDVCHANWHEGLRSLNGQINAMLLAGLFPFEILNKLQDEQY